MIAVVTDAISDISPARATLRGIHVVHQYIHLAGKTYSTSELSAAQTLRVMEERNILATTSPATLPDYESVFRRLLRTNDEVICICFSSKMSQGHRNASAAAELFDGRVTVIDSKTVSYPVAFQALRAAELADEHASMADIVTELRQLSQHQLLVFRVHSLKNLRKTGRISALRSVMGSLLDVKPLMGIKDGSGVPLGSPIGTRRADAQMAEMAIRFAAELGQPVQVAYMHSPGGEEDATALREHLSGMGYHDAGLHSLGTAISGVTGMGTVGLAVEPIHQKKNIHRASGRY